MEQWNGAPGGNLGRVRFEHTWEDARLDACFGRSPIMVGDVTVDRYKPQSSSCDELVHSYCVTNPLAVDCVCFLEQQELLYTLPVACWGAQCQQGQGYRTAKMAEADCSKQGCVEQAAASGLLHTNIECGNMFFYAEKPGTYTGAVFVTYVLPIFMALLFLTVMLVAFAPR